MDQNKIVEILPIALGGPMGPIHPVWGHVLVSFCPVAFKDQLAALASIRPRWG